VVVEEWFFQGHIGNGNTGNICVPLREFLQHQQAVLADFHFFPEALNFDLSANRLAISIQ